MQQEERVIRGVLNIDKPLGLTSMSVCRVVKGKLKAGGAPKRVKVGHGGTLDPLATGVLVILIGKATKEQDAVMTSQKQYVATIDLANVSASADLEIEPEPVEIVRVPTRDDVEAAIQSFIGDIQQAPPAYSAVKIGGKRSYDLARQGNAIEPEKRPVRIDSIHIESYEFPELVIRIDCGKGTYIRSLARDLGVSLNVGGMLTGLRRTQVGAHLIERSLTLDALPDVLNPYEFEGTY